MTDIVNLVASPLVDKKYCNYYYFFMWASLLGFVLVFTSSIFAIIKDFKKMKFDLLLNIIILNINTFLAYFANRLLYSMCIKSI
jgi:hypothetical protein